MTDTTAAELPIIFQPWQLEAIRDKRMTQFRVPVEPQPEPKYDRLHTDNSMPWYGWWWSPATSGEGSQQRDIKAFPKPPHGKPGQALWVQEEWGMCYDMHVWKLGAGPFENQATEWQPAESMPRWASRFTLKVTKVWVERVQEVSEESARAEGCSGDCPVGHIPSYRAAPCSYHCAQQWQAKYEGTEFNWNNNPWCFCHQVQGVES